MKTLTAHAATDLPRTGRPFPETRGEDLPGQPGGPAAALLVESERRFALATTAARIGIWDWNVLTDALVWDRQMHALYGLGEGDFAGTCEAWQKRLHPDDRDRAELDLAAALAGARGFHTEFRIVWPSGEVRWLEAHGEVQWAEDGAATRMIGVHRDVTARRRAEDAARVGEEERKGAKVAAALRDSALRYSFLADAVPLIIWTARPDGSALYYNKAWFEYTGLPPTQTDAWNWGEVLHPDDLEPCAARWEQSFTRGEAFEIEVRFRRASDGSYRWHLGRALPMRDALGRIKQWVGTCTEIDATKRNTETLQAAHDALGLRVLERTSQLLAAKETAEAANRAKSDFLANMSHEIRTPMNGIIGMTDLALETDLTREQRDYLTMVKTSAHALLGLINGILDFSKIEAGKLEFESIDFSLRECVGATLQPLRLRAEQKCLELTVEIAGDVPDHLVGDSMRLRQILINLIDNAIKFTARGRVRLHAAVESAGDGGCGLHFSLSDSGPGIPQDKQSLIFEAFAQADGSTTRHYGGTGLGLAIVSRLVAQMRGKIWVESTVGAGTTFHFTAWFGVTPASSRPVGILENAAPAAPGAAPEDAKLPPPSLRILLVEDNMINRVLAAAVLEKRGHTLVHAANGREAVALAAGEAFDLIFMDVQMPEMDGFEATRLIREQEQPGSRHTPIVAMTAHAMTGDRERCLAAGMDDYLSKPLQKSALFGIVQRIAETRRSPEPPVAPAPTETAPFFSRAQLLDELDGDEDLMRRMIALFQENTPLLLAEIRGAIARRSASDLARSTHTLVGSLAAFGAHEARRLTGLLEAQAHLENYETTRQLLEALERGTAEIHAALSAFATA